MPSITEIPERVSAAPSREPGARFARIASLHIRGFRSIVDATLAPGRLCALVGEAQVGKSNLLAAVNALLDESVYMAPTDATTLAEGPILIEAMLETGGRLALEASGQGVSRAGKPPPVLYLPAAERATISVPTMPLAPARLSTTNWRFSNCDMPVARCLAITSVPPPGANGTTIRTGFAG